MSSAKARTRSFSEIGYLSGKLDFLDPDSFTTRVTQFYQSTSAFKEDSDSDSETGTSPGIVREDITIKEKKSLKWVSKH